MTKQCSMNDAGGVSLAKKATSPLRRVSRRVFAGMGAGRVIALVAGVLSPLAGVMFVFRPHIVAVWVGDVGGAS